MHLIPLILIIILALLIIAGGSDARADSDKLTSSTPSVTVRQIGSLSKAQLEKKLADLAEPAETKAPEPRMLVTCYVPIPPPERAEYVCPSCGEKTIYGPDHSQFLTRDLHGCRRDASSIVKASKGAISLDESSFCKKCSPVATTPTLTLIVTYADGDKHAVSPVCSHDLRIMRDFLKGWDSYINSNDGESPLKPQTPRLRELLGLSQDTTAKK